MGDKEGSTTAIRTINNAVFNLLGWVWPIGLNLLTVPYVVNELGEEGFGTYSLVLTLFFLQLGFGKASTKYVAEYWSKRDTGRINRILGTTLLVYSMIGCLGVLVTELSLGWLLEAALRIPPDLVPVSRTAFQIGGLGFLTGQIATAFRAIPAGLQRFDIVNKITITLNTLSTLLTVIVLMFGGGLLCVVLVRLAINLLRILAFLLAAKNLIPSLHLGYHLDRSVLSELAGFESFTVVNQLADRASFELTRFLVGSLLGVSAVTYYVVPMDLTSQVHRFLDHFTSMLFPLSSELIGTGKWSKLRKMYFKATKYVVILSTLAYLPFVLLSLGILDVWMGQGFADRSSLTLAVLAFSHYLLSFRVTTYHVLNGIGKPEINAISSMMGGVINVGLCFVLIPRLGILGAAMANLVSMVHVPIAILYANNSVLGVSTLSVLKEAYVKPWLTGAGIALLFFSFRMSPRSIWSLLAVCIVLALVYAILLLLSGVFDAEDRSLFQRYLRDAFSRVFSV